MHPTTGELRAYLDDEASPERAASIREHLAGCPRCREARRRMLEREKVVGEALNELRSDPDLVQARRELNGRLGREGISPESFARASDRGRAPVGRGAWSGWRPILRTAAAVLLLLGGITAALPGSPVRAWIVEALGGREAPSVVPESEGEPPPAPSDPSAADAPGEAGVRVQARDGSIRVDLTDVAGTRVRVVLVEGDRAGVSASDAGGFRTGAGFIGVESPGNAVTVELPRSVGSAEIRTEDRVLLRKRGDALEFPTLTPEADGDAFLLTIPGPPQEGDG